MATPPPERDRAMAGNGGRFAAIGAAIAIVGIVVWIAWKPGIGAAITILGCIPLMAGIGLLASAALSRGARSGKPYT
jgi:hypothetical protein